MSVGLQRKTAYNIRFHIKKYWNSVNTWNTFWYFQDPWWNGKHLLHQGRVFVKIYMPTSYLPRFWILLPLFHQIMNQRFYKIFFGSNFHLIDAYKVACLTEVFPWNISAMFDSTMYLTLWIWKILIDWCLMQTFPILCHLGKKDWNLKSLHWCRRSSRHKMMTMYLVGNLKKKFNLSMSMWLQFNMPNN